MAHAIFGVPYTLNAANYAYFVALEECHRLGSPEALSVFVEELLNLHRGQGQDIVWRDTQKVPSEKEYYSMVLDKTGGLTFGRAGRRPHGRVLGTRQERVPRTSGSIRVVFPDPGRPRESQVRRVRPLQSYERRFNGGQIFLPHPPRYKGATDDTRLLNILKQKTENTDVKKHAVEFMESWKFREDALTALAAIKGDIASAIAALGGYDQLVKLVGEIRRAGRRVVQAGHPLSCCGGATCSRLYVSVVSRRRRGGVFSVLRIILWAGICALTVGRVSRHAHVCPPARWSRGPRFPEQLRWCCWTRLPQSKGRVAHC